MKKTKIVITGGPSGGKTTLIEALKRELRRTVSVVPEAASIIYRGGFPRTKSVNGRIAAQRSIYFLQRELEDFAASEYEQPVIVCDRGSLDGLAYWPFDLTHFCNNLKTNIDIELSRYDWIIHLDTAQEEAFDTSNPIRTENYSEAFELNQKVKAAWSAHPHRLILAHENDFISKIEKATALINLIADGNSFSAIQEKTKALF